MKYKDLENEWDVFNYFKLKNDKYLSNKENLIRYVMTVPKKIFIILILRY